MSASLFSFEHYDLQTITHEGHPLFYVSDVARLLGIKNTTNALKRLPPDEKLTLRDIQGEAGSPHSHYITEAGFWRLVFSVRRPACQKLKTWLFHSVLPAIRADGRFVLPPSPKRTDRANDHAVLLRAIKAHVAAMVAETAGKGPTAPEKPTA